MMECTGSIQKVQMYAVRRRFAVDTSLRLLNERKQGIPYPGDLPSSVSASADLHPVQRFCEDCCCFDAIPVTGFYFHKIWIELLVACLKPNQRRHRLSVYRLITYGLKYTGGEVKVRIMLSDFAQLADFVE